MRTDGFPVPRTSLPTLARSGVGPESAPVVVRWLTCQFAGFAGFDCIFDARGHGVFTP